MQSGTPKWATPERQNCLVELWAVLGNKCLQGHTACSNPEHYHYTDSRVTIVPKAVKLPCKDRNDNPILDGNGNQVYLTVYKAIKAQMKLTKVARLYDKRTDELIRDWIADDKAQRLAEWLAEQKELHSFGQPTEPLRGQFSAISREIYAESQPLYYLDGLGMSGLTLKPFAKVRISSSYVTLFVTLGDALRTVSKNRRRKAIRHGKPLPKEAEAVISQLANEAVKHYIAH